jgi:hypothetical protein
VARALIYAVAAILALSCQRGEGLPTGEEETVEPAPAEGLEPLAAPAVPSEAQRSEIPQEPEIRKEAQGPLEEAEEGTEVDEQQEEALPPSRDLAAELKAAVGSLTECVRDLQTSQETAIRVDVSATVRPTGRVILAEASGTGLSNDARQCITRRIEAVALKPLDDAASRRVSATIEIAQTPATILGAPVGAPEPQLRNVRQPLPPRPEVAPSGRPIQDTAARPIQDGTSRPIQETPSRRITGPKPRPIDGHEVDESAKQWR